VGFQDRLTVEVRVAPDAREACVPSLLLQPLVENAVRHGVAKRRGPGRVEVSAERRNGTLEIAVRDDGVGLGGGADTGLGIGLANTRARLAELYPKPHTLELRDAPGGGLEVTIEIPYHTEELADGPRTRARG
jgi:LytS/YehU family sensor histidine kinase